MNSRLSAEERLNKELKAVQRSSNISEAVTVKDFTSCIESLELSDLRLRRLAEAAQTIIKSREEEQKKRQDLQTFQAKIHNIAKEMNLPYEDVLKIMGNR